MGCLNEDPPWCYGTLLRDASAFDSAALDDWCESHPTEDSKTEKAFFMSVILLVDDPSTG